MTRPPSSDAPRRGRRRRRLLVVAAILAAIAASIAIQGGSYADATEPSSPPPVTFLTAHGPIGQGDIFITPTSDTGTYANGPEILDIRDELFGSMPSLRPRLRLTSELKLMMVNRF
jgi:hypothetical protein